MFILQKDTKRTSLKAPSRIDYPVLWVTDYNGLMPTARLYCWDVPRMIEHHNQSSKVKSLIAFDNVGM